MRRPLLLVLAALSLLAPAACSRQGGSTATFCELIADVDDLFMLLQDFDATAPGELDRRFEESVAEYRSLERASPREIKPDVAELGNVVEDILETVQRNGDDRVAIATELSEVQKRHPGAAAAAVRIIAYTDEKCGIKLQGGPPDPAAGLDGEPGSTPTTG